MASQLAVAPDVAAQRRYVENGGLVVRLAQLAFEARLQHRYKLRPFTWQVGARRFDQRVHVPSDRRVDDASLRLLRSLAQVARDCHRQVFAFEQALEEE